MTHASEENRGYPLFYPAQADAHRASQAKVLSSGSSIPKDTIKASLSTTLLYTFQREHITFLEKRVQY